MIANRPALVALALAALGLAAVPGMLLDPDPAIPTHDTIPPVTSITSGPGARTTDTTPRFRFSSNEKNSRFVCKRDGKRFSVCSSPKTLKPLAYGRHGFYVRAIDPFGNRDATAAAYTFKVVRQ